MRKFFFSREISLSNAWAQNGSIRIYETSLSLSIHLLFFVLFVVWLFVLCDALSCIGFLSFLSELSLLSHWDPIINNPSHFNACTFTVTTILLILRCHKIGHNVGTPCWIVSHFVALAKCTIPTAHVIFIPIYIYFYVFCMYTISRKFIESNFVCGNIAYKCDTVAS